MKKIMITMAIVFSFPMFAGVPSAFGGTDLPPPFFPGIFPLSESGVKPSPDCGSYTQMTLDTGALVGPFAYFENLMTATSLCDMYVDLNPRFVKINQIIDIGCGSYEYLGTWEGPNIELTNIIITDHRGRLCDDYSGPVVFVEFNFMTVSSNPKLVLKTFGW